MGYTTDFSGEIEVVFKDKSGRDEAVRIINGLSQTRRVKRNLARIKDRLDKPIDEYGVEGEFYFNEDDLDNFGQTTDESVVDYNSPPSTQPSLWLDWQLQPDDYDDKVAYISWTGGEKFYNYVEWMFYIKKIIEKYGGKLVDGNIVWHGEDPDDVGVIIAHNGNLIVKELVEEPIEVVIKKIIDENTTEKKRFVIEASDMEVGEAIVSELKRIGVLKLANNYSVKIVVEEEVDVQ